MRIPTHAPIIIYPTLHLFQFFMGGDKNTKIYPLRFIVIPKKMFFIAYSCHQISTNVLLSLFQCDNVFNMTVNEQ